VLFFPTAGTGSGTLKSTQLDTFDEQQDPNVPFTSIPRRPDGSELRKRLDAMISEERKPEKIPDDELIELQKTIDDLKADNESLRQEKRETDKRISDIENQIKQLLITNKGN
jgi:FtsZ-binding cell division protein ZapB